MKKIVLASKSPRRIKIMHDMGLEFEIVPSLAKEKHDDNTFAYEKVEELARQKVINVSEQIDYDAVVISADTVVVLDNEIMNKPKSEKEAFLMLKKLSGKEHKVVTAICVLDTSSKKIKQTSVTSLVKFNDLTDEQIKNYITDFKPFDKAGSYGIQELPDNWINSITGSFENIIGLCPKALKTILQEFQ